MSLDFTVYLMIDEDGGAAVALDAGDIEEAATEQCLTPGYRVIVLNVTATVPEATEVHVIVPDEVPADTAVTAGQRG